MLFKEPNSKCTDARFVTGKHTSRASGRSPVVDLHGMFRYTPESPPNYNEPLPLGKPDSLRSAKVEQSEEEAQSVECRRPWDAFVLPCTFLCFCFASSTSCTIHPLCVSYLISIVSAKRRCDDNTMMERRRLKFLYKIIDGAKAVARMLFDWIENCKRYPIPQGGRPKV